jgi:phenylacetate-CoA ligase
MWQPTFESMAPAALRTLQLERLRETVGRVYERVPFYRARLDAAGVKPTDLRALEDLRRVPFTVKEDFRQNYPFGLLAVPRREVVRVHASSGTTGKSTVVGYTKRDLEMWSDVVARFLAMAGVTEDSVCQVAFGYGLFTGGFGLHYGIERIGATVVPAASGHTRRHIQLMKDFGSTHLICTPSYAMHICETAREMGVDLVRDTRLRTACVGGEPWSEQMRVQMKSLHGIDGFDNYGLSELIGPGVSGESAVCSGMHIAEDHFLPEIIDPQTGEALPPGARGELVLTSLTREAQPVLRYRTRDITTLDAAPCPCGRTHARMARVTGRSDDMLIIRGVNVFPTQIEHAFLETQGTSPNYQIIIDRQGALDSMEVKIEVTEAMLSDEMKNLHRMELELQKRLSEALSVHPKITLVEPGTLPRSEGKAVRVIDKRPKA